MKTKLHIGIFILLLAFVGTYIEQKTVPNQQIVIQFSDKNISSEDTKGTIEAIQNKLQSVGVNSIQIDKHQDGQLRITYYSNTDIALIQNILSEDKALILAFETGEKHSSNFPVDNTIKSYELNVSEIQIDSDFNWDFEGIQIVEFNQKSDRFNYPKVNSSAESIDLEHNTTIIKVALKVNTSISRAIDNITYKIPEVRAGPAA